MIPTKVPLRDKNDEFTTGYERSVVVKVKKPPPSSK
jgi:hypothetical protein